MSEKSVGSKGKPPDLQDAVSEGDVEVTNEKSGSNLNENASSRTRIEKVEKTESPKVHEKGKGVDKKPEIKTQMKINGVKNGVSKPSPKREEVGRFSTSSNRSSSRGKTEFKSPTLTVAATSNQSKQDVKKSGKQIFLNKQTSSFFEPHRWCNDLHTLYLFAIDCGFKPQSGQRQ
jgi:hypothetical protein